MIVTDLPAVPVAGRLPRGWSAHKGEDGTVYLWDGANHVPLASAAPRAVAEGVRMLDEHRKFLASRAVA